jgi:hypothetical protein
MRCVLVVWILGVSCQPFHANAGGGASSSSGGAVTTIVTAPTAPMGISAIGDSVYWAETPDVGQVYSAPKKGGPRTLIADGPNAIRWTTTDGTSLFWIDDSQGHCEPKTGLFQHGLGQSSPTRLAYCTDVFKQPARIAVDGAHVFWTRDGGVMGIPRSDVDATDAITLTDNSRDAFPGALAITVNAEWVFFSFAGGIGRAPKDLSTWTLHVGQSAAHSAALVADNTDLYYASADAIMRVPVDTPGASPTAFAPNQDSPLALAMFHEEMYWSTSGSGSDGTIRAQSKSSTSFRSLAEGQAAPSSIAVDADGVYWTCADGAIRSASP